MKKSDQKGNAAIVAVLVIIMLVAVGSAIMVVTGRKTIEENSSTDAYVNSNIDYVDSIADSSESEPEEPEFYPVPADTYKDVNIKDLTCKSSILIDADSNEILAGQDINKHIYPASLTKMLTLLVAVENAEDLDKEYTFNAKEIDKLVSENASMAGFKAGEKVKIKDLLYAAILPSGADGTTGLANAICGSEKKFVELMNQKIEELGLEDTEFINASGLHDKKHFSSVEDLAVITKQVYDNELCRKVITAETYTTSKTKQHKKGIKLTSIVHGRFEGYFLDVDGNKEADAKLLGGKTGFTDEAKYTLSTIVKYNGHHYICITAKSSNEFTSTEDTIAIYEKYIPGSKNKDHKDAKKETSSKKSSDTSGSSNSKNSTDNEDYEA